MQFHDHPQHVTIGISSDHLPAGVRPQSARCCVLECMTQIDERNAALLHRGPSMILNEDSATARKGPDSPPRFRSLHPLDDSGGLGILSSIDVMLIISWTRSGQSRWRPAGEALRNGRPRLGRNYEIRPPVRIATIGFTGQGTKTMAPPVKYRWGQWNWLRGRDLNPRPSGYEG